VFLFPLPGASVKENWHMQLQSEVKEDKKYVGVRAFDCDVFVALFLSMQAVQDDPCVCPHGLMSESLVPL
jgi:hypothetical protein